MSEIYPLLIGFVGFLTGVAINFVIEKLYIYRNILSDNELFYKSEGWYKLLLWPWGIKDLKLSRKIRILLVELSFIFITPCLWFSPPDSVEFFWGFPLLIYFTIVAVIDLEYKLIFTQVSFVGAILGLIVGLLQRDLTQTLLGGLVGYVIMYGMYKFGELYVKRLSRRRGEEVDEVALGFGDVYIGGIIGLMIGWPGILIGLFVGVFAGGLVSLFIIIYKSIIGQYDSAQAIPYAPFLIFGTIILLFFKTWF